MKLFIYEHLTSGALAGQDYSESLSHEGDAMLHAVCHDLISLGYQITIMRDSRLAETTFDGKLNTFWVDSLSSYGKYWKQSLGTFDFFLVIAPETDQTLATLARQVRNAGKCLLGCSEESIALYSNKHQTWQHLQKQHIPSPQTWLSASWLHGNFAENRNWIVKPIDGAGSEQTFLFNTNQTREYLLNPNIDSNLIVQEYIDGQPLSLSLLITDNNIELLSINRQVLNLDQHQLSLSHCEVKADSPLSTHKAIELISQIHRSQPGLWGYVGIDIIYSAEKVWVIEINPRLTSSYAEPAMRMDKNPALALHHYLSQISNKAVANDI